MGDDRIDSRLEEGSRKKSCNVDYTFLSLAYCEFTAGGGGDGTDTQCSGVLIKYS